MIQQSTRKKNHCNKNERKRLSGWCFMGIWAISHGNHHIRAYMHHVCLIQSISARKANHIKLGTRSGSSQCQLHFTTKMVSIGWSGCEWLPSECKNAHFQAFPPLAPSVIFLPRNTVYICTVYDCTFGDNSAKHTVYIYMCTVYDCTFGCFPAKNTMYTLYIYGLGQPY